MNGKVVLLLLLILGIAAVKNMGWLAWSMAAVITLVFIAETGRTTTVIKEKPKKNEEILTPVIVTDVGEPPLLYPEKFKLKVWTKGKASPGWKDAVKASASFTHMLYRAFTGKSIKSFKYEDKWKIDKIRDK